MGQSIKAWVGLTAVVALIAVAAIWLLVISPTKASTATARDSIESEQNNSIVLTKKLDSLKSQFAKLDENRAELDALEVQIPTSARTADFRRTLVERASTSGVTIVSISTGVSTAVVAAAPAPVAAPSTDGGDSNSDTATASPSPSADAEAPAPTTTTTISGQVLVGIPLDITIVGRYDAVRAFIASLQTTEGRLFVFSGLGLITQLDSPASGGRPETVNGDVEVAIQGLLLALTPAADSAADPSDEPTPSPAPLPSTERNPFAPVVSAGPAE